MPLAAVETEPELWRQVRLRRCRGCRQGDPHPHHQAVNLMLDQALIALTTAALVVAVAALWAIVFHLVPG
jgi:hypothetical protein